MENKKEDDIGAKNAEDSQDVKQEPGAAACEDAEAGIPEKQAGPEAAGTQGKPEEAVDTAEDLKRQLDEMSDKYLRLMAEFDNFKKRVSRDYERLVESANERLVLELIEVRENFERAIKTVEKEQEKSNFYNGIMLIYTKFDEILKKNGLEPFAQAGEEFDPLIHDALMKVPNETVPEDHIAEVFEKGYRLKRKVIRHAKVLVSSGKPQPAQKKSSGENGDTEKQ